jgi:hypothetical protein
MKDTATIPPIQGENPKNTPYTGLYFRLLLSVIVAHIIVVYGETEPTLSMMLRKGYYIALLASAVIAFLLISYVHYTNRWLNRQLDWEHQQLQRGGYQLVLGLVVPGVLAFLMAAFYFWLNGLNILKTTYLRFDFQFIMLMLFCLNIYYYAVYQNTGWRKAKALLQEKEQEISRKAEELAAVQKQQEPNATQRENDHPEGVPVIKEFFQVNTPIKVIPIRVEQICYFFRKNGHNFLHTIAGDVYAIPETLKEVEERMVREQFFRINRQMIVSFSSCISFRPGKNKTIEVTLYPPFNIKHRDEGTLEGGSTYVTVSEDRVHDFRLWMDR